MKLFAGFGRRHVLIALGFSFVVELAHLSYAWLGKEELRAGIIAIWTVLYFVNALIGLGCVVAADNLLGDAAGTAKRFILSMLAAAIVTTVWGETVLYLWPWIEKEHMVFLGTLHRIAFQFSMASGWAMLLIGLYTMLQASRRATERLHQTQLAALVAQRADASPQVDISVAPEARTLPMPAMLLLPLVRWALDGRSATLLQIRAQRRDAALEVSVRSNSVGSAASTEPDIAGVRERLARLFAGHASLDVTISADARHVRLQIPAS